MKRILMFVACSIIACAAAAQPLTFTTDVFGRYFPKNDSLYGKTEYRVDRTLGHRTLECVFYDHGEIKCIVYEYAKDTLSSVSEIIFWKYYSSAGVVKDKYFIVSVRRASLERIKTGVIMQHYAERVLSTTDKDRMALVTRVIDMMSGTDVVPAQ